MEAPKERRGIFGDLGVALGFLTVFPVPDRVWDGPREYGRAFSWFPVVGLVVGLALGLAAVSLSFALPAGVSAALVVAFWVFLTGGLHFDGLMDSCDGLLCARSAEERIEVMRDSRVGAFGVLGGVCLVLVKFSALAALFESSAMSVAASLVAAAVAGRWMMALAVVAFPYNRHGGALGESFVAGAGARQLFAATLSAALVLSGVAVLQGSAGLAVVAVAASVAATGAVAWLAVSRIRGLTGDVYGAICEVSEAAALVAVAGWVL